MSRFQIEVRAGEGGDDAELFARELRDAICAYLRRHGHDVHEQPSDARTLVLVTSAPDRRARRLAGTHRVQRIPSGSTSRHTSTATVVVLPMAERGSELGGLRRRDLRIDRYRGRGKGGQRKNKVATAVRVRHHPSGIVITRETGRSQDANLQDALAELRQRLRAARKEHFRRGQEKQRAEQVHAQRAAKRFTHNQQRGEVLDHATGTRWRARDFTRGKLD